MNYWIAKSDTYERFLAAGVVASLGATAKITAKIIEAHNTKITNEHRDILEKLNNDLESTKILVNTTLPEEERQPQTRSSKQGHKKPDLNRIAKRLALKKNLMAKIDGHIEGLGKLKVDREIRKRLLGSEFIRRFWKKGNIRLEHIQDAATKTKIHYSTLVKYVKQAGHEVDGLIKVSEDDLEKNKDYKELVKKLVKLKKVRLRELVEKHLNDFETKDHEEQLKELFTGNNELRNLD